MTWGRWYWPPALIVIGLIIFGPEIYALATNSYNTLSNWVWTTLQVTRNEPVHDWNATQFLTLGLFVMVTSWLFFHFWFHLFT